MDRSAIEEIISRRLCSIETALPAKVTSVAEDGSLTVVILIKKVTVDGIVDTENLAIEGVKPFVIGNGNASVDIEIQKDAQVLLLGLSRHAREWLGTSSDDAVIPKSAHGNMLNDLVAIPLFRGDRDNGKNSKISLGADGTVLVESKYGQSLKFKDDGSIDFTPKSGKNVKINGSLDVDGSINSTDNITTQKNISAVNYNNHTHNVGAVPATSPIPTTPPAPAPTP